MDNDKIAFLLSSFIGPLISDSNISDISYNGAEIYYMHRLEGRKKADIACDFDRVQTFLRHLANIGEAQFSVSSPYLDLSFGRYRINAVHHAIGRYKNEKCLSFSIRIAAPRVIDFFHEQIIDERIYMLFKCLLRLEQSIVIAGATSTGKTELQKYLLTLLTPNSRVIVIDTLQELEAARHSNLDLTCWQVLDYHPEASARTLIRNGLRANPDWLIVAESRGGEMFDALQAVMSGHPLITTIHARSLLTMSTRITRLIQQADHNLDYQLIHSDVIEHLPVYIYLAKTSTTDGKIERFIEAIGLIENAKLHVVYQADGRKVTYGKLPPLWSEKLCKIDADFVKIWEMTND